ncbi:MAG: hypothetical protein JXM70_19195, partial [Pirellulales bacterium]|nr:hypothetical protein [Pirellulales bacterium]
GIMTVSDGGTVETAGAHIAALADSTGSVSLSGAGTTWNESLDLNVGGTADTPGGNGSLSVTSDALLSVAGELILYDNSSFTLDAGSVNAGSFTLSENVQFNFRDGSLRISGGYFTNSNAAGTTIDGNSPTALPTLRLVDAASAACGPLLAVGYDKRGEVEIRGGSTMSADVVNIGVNTDSQGTVTVADPGSQLQFVGTLQIGENGSGELNIIDGATVQCVEIYIGCNSGADGKVTVGGNQSALTCDTLDVGSGPAGPGGTAALDVESSGSIFVDQDLNVWSVGSVVIEGGSITVGGQMNCGGPVDLIGGTLSVGQITCTAGKFNFSGGTLNITATDLIIDDSEPLGSSLDLTSGQHINVAYQTIVEAGSLVRVDRGASLTADEIHNHGELELTGYSSELRAVNLLNTGLIQGNGCIKAVLQNDTNGQIRVESGNRIVVDADAPNSINQGTIDLADGTFEYTNAFINGATGFIAGRGTIRCGGELQNDGAIVLSGGFSDIHGDVVNDEVGSTIVITGGGVTTFYDDVHSDGLIRVSADCAAVFLGEFSGTGGTSGTGTVYLEGDLRPGNSPAELHFGGDLVLGNNASMDIELAGNEPGDGYDVVDVSGMLSIDGELNVTFIDGFSPLPTDTFDILDFTEISGTFSQINLPSLGSHMEWDTSRLYTTGELAMIYDPFAGDANRDGKVDDADAAILAVNWFGGPGLSWDQGDFNGDGFVNDIDATLLAVNWQKSIGVNVTSIPEPSIALLLMCIAISAAMLRRRNFNQHIRQQRRTWR